MPKDSSTTVASAFARWGYLTGGDIDMFYQVANDAQTSLNESGMYKAAFQRLTIGVNDVGNGIDGYLMLPRRYASVVGSSYCCRPTPIFSQWYHYIENGPGVQSDNRCWTGILVDCGDGWPSQRHIPLGLFPTMQVVISNPADAGKTVRLFGLDQDKKDIYTPSGEGYDITTAYPNSAPSSQVVTQLDKVEAAQDFIGNWGLAYVISGFPIRIGWYEPTETIPNYHKYSTGRVNLTAEEVGTGCQCWPSGVPRAIELLCRYRTVTLKALTDFIIPGNLQAFGAAMRAIQHENALNDEKAQVQWNRAYTLLDNEARTIRGGARPIVELEGWGWNSRLPSAI